MSMRRGVSAGVAAVALAAAAMAPAWAAPPAKTITLTAPAGGQFVGSAVEITWTSTGFAPGDHLVVKANGADVATVAVAAGSYTWLPTGDGATLLRLQSASIKSAEITVHVDTTAPAIAMASRTPSNAHGWNQGDVEVVWSCTDAGSGVVDATDIDTIGGEGADLSAHGTCADAVGNRASDTVTGINIDRTAPSIAEESRSEATSDGWYNGDVVVVWSCADDLSGAVDATTSDTVSGEGTDQTAEGTCTDRADNTATAAVTGIHIDLGAPTASVDEPFLGTTIGVVTGTAEDGLSGVATVEVTFVHVATGDALVRDATCAASCTTWTVTGVPAGVYDVTATATDRAANTGSASGPVRLLVL